MKYTLEFGYTMCGSYTKDIEDNNRYRKSVLSHLDSNSKMKLRCCIFAK
jgi:hypothetical protein